MSCSVRILSWEEAATDATSIREEVFVMEQRVPRELEMDVQDPHCDHAIACDETGRAVGTGRLLPDGHIGRMAVRRELRGSGVGSAILEALLERARKRGMSRIELHAQTRASPFYARHGFRPFGEVFLEAGIAHVAMALELAASDPPPANT